MGYTWASGHHADTLSSVAFPLKVRHSAVKSPVRSSVPVTVPSATVAMERGGAGERGRGKEGKMGRWEDGKMGRWEETDRGV